MGKLVGSLLIRSNDIALQAKLDTAKGNHKRLVMKCTQFSLFTGDQMANNSERAITVVVSGHNPAHREWRSCNSLSDVYYLCTRKDGNLSTQSVPEEKSINYADQLIELATDYIDLRIRFTLLSASGPDTVVLPVSTGADRRSFPHSLFHFQLFTED
jgi:hypothetical protein